MRIRRATIDDAEILGRLHVAAWRETYVDLFEKAALDLLDAAERSRSWRETVGALDADPMGAAFLVFDAADAPVGFAACGPQRAEHLAALNYDGDIIALYLLKRVQGMGLGRRLMGVTASHLSARGAASASVWVFRDNLRARRFYEALGGEKTPIEGDWTVLGATLPDVSYGWRNLAALASA